MIDQTFFFHGLQKISEILKAYGLEVILEYYLEHDDLTESHKIEISKAIVAYFLHFQIWLERKDFPKITKLITAEFPTEDPFYYYQPPANSHSTAKGKLFHRYNNQSGSWRAKLGGIYKNNVKSSKHQRKADDIGKIKIRQSKIID